MKGANLGGYNALLTAFLFYLSVQAAFAFRLSQFSTFSSTLSLSLAPLRRLVSNSEVSDSRFSTAQYATTDEKQTQDNASIGGGEHVDKESGKDDNDNSVTSASTSSSSPPVLSSSSTAFTAVLNEYKEEFDRLRGTAELVDRLENLVSKHPGIELDMDLYRNLYSFPLDDFQEEGLSALQQGNNVIVSTPTGSGKTLVGELAIYFALMMGLRVAYTTPLKALSNQKFKDFKEKYGGDRVGLLTGDISINRGAPIAVMTTEVFRNMIYGDDAEEQLAGLFAVVFDEFHYMNDPDRGTVWEESVISCPKHVRILALSATMGNVDDVQGWINSIHGPTELIISTHRPVPLRYMFAMRKGLQPLFKDPNAGPGAANGVQKSTTGASLDPGCSINPSILKMEEQQNKASQMRTGRNGRPIKSHKVNSNSLIPTYGDVSNDLQEASLLPAIVFIFSRVGCEQAAQMVMKSKTRLLSDEEVTYVTQAITAFAKNNPEIPISRNMVLMLQSGVAVHHAGLIPVWKSFIEDLFNANKIKVLFATETLAAGVNMPARTTVVSTVTKRINSEIVKLKTSQLLQMAGRAGRRGKDTLGTVVIMRNKFEDVRVGHKILTSKIDGIGSHFKTSYSLTVTLLETKSMDECRQLIEKGFGAYLLTQRKKSQKNNADFEENIEKYKNVLQKHTLKMCREYLKIVRRLDKEKKNENFLLQKISETDGELVQAIADYMPLGIGLQLYNDETGYFLGDVKWGSNNRNGGYGVLTKEGNMYIVLKEHIRAFSETGASISSKAANDLLEIVSIASSWDEVFINTKNPLLKGVFPQGSIAGHVTGENAIIQTALDEVDAAPSFPAQQIPGSLIRQRKLVAELQAELDSSPISESGEGKLVLEALRYAASLKDPLGFVGSPSPKGAGSSLTGDVYAWRMFQNVVQILNKFEALDGTNATDLGQMVSSLSADNELWLAMVLQHEKMRKLQPGEFASVISALVIDGFKAQNAMFRHAASENVQEVFDQLDSLAWELKSSQISSNIDFPVQLTTEVGGLVESWANGVTWRELCKDTSLDQGDVCRLLRRTVEILKQVPLAYGIPPEIAQISIDAARAMDRFPVADEQDSDGDGTTLTAGAGVGFDSGIAAIDNVIMENEEKSVSDIEKELMDLIEEDENENESNSLDLDALEDILKDSNDDSDFPDDFFDENDNDSRGASMDRSNLSLGDEFSDVRAEDVVDSLARALGKVDKSFTDKNGDNAGHSNINSDSNSNSKWGKNHNKSSRSRRRR